MNCEICGIPIEIRYRKVKNLNLYITPPDGCVLITVPLGITMEKISGFVEKKKNWILRHQETMRQKSTQEMEPISEEELERLKENVRFYAGKWEPKMGVHATGWTLREMKTRWGSCTPSTGKIRLNSKLVHCPEECLEYVLVHELCHLIEPSHNQRFKSYMTTFLPDWKERKKKLKDFFLA